ncbi:hypothetical protein OAN307_c16450 [Octadecabacter antarcticus 307]|uniref:DDE domain-containing protein n=1 Tax=Octadecabacter antarcticus 307 TaxID=391626 RepID=M9R522_9RHOB|nr:hypothetical protein OAN307_c16450 [Octadecabacter antarcticus 307]
MNHIEADAFLLIGQDAFSNMKSAGSYFCDGDVLYGCLRQYLNKVHMLVTDKLRSYGAARKIIGNANKLETGRWLNNRVENSHQPFRKRERTMLRFRRMRSLQKFVSVEASVHNPFNQERHLSSRDNFKLSRDATLSEWRQLCSA